MATNAEDDRQIMERFRQLVPPLGQGNYKGSHGKVAVIGGCAEFTGAPFFAAMSALRVGADMAYVICTPSAATAIKSYSPELMVLPYLPEMKEGEVAPAPGQVDRAVSRIGPWLARATAVVMGPGLGDDLAACETAAALALQCRARRLPLLVDGSALSHVVAMQPEIVQGYRRALLTPNVAELGRIAAAVGTPLPGRMSDAWLQHAARVAEAYEGPVLLAKGEVDLLCGPGPAAPGQQAQGSQPDGQRQEGPDGGPRPLLRCAEPGALRRCGGQGDVVAGTAGAFLCWAAKHRAAAAKPAAEPGPQARRHSSEEEDARSAEADAADTDMLALCAYVACRVMRRAAAAAYRERERSMLAGDIIPHLYPAFKEVVGCT